MRKNMFGLLDAERFSTRLEYNVLSLKSLPSQIVISSFIGQKSLSPLDLQLWQGALDWEEKRFRNQTSFDFSSPTVHKSFFCSKESFRNYLVPERRLLYTLNLDVPQGREYDGISAPYRLLPHNPHSLFVALQLAFSYCHRISMLVERAFEQTACKIKLLKWMVNFEPLETFALPKFIQIFYSKHLYSECVDSNFVMKVFGKFIELRKFSTIRELKWLEFFLYHARQCDYDVRREKRCGINLIDHYMGRADFETIQLVLKYEDRAYYSEESYSYTFGSLLFNKDFEAWNDANESESHISKFRLHRIHQIFFIYWTSTAFPERRGANEALRIIWSSIPDPFVCLEEMVAAYGGSQIPDDFINGSFDFYKEAIHQTGVNPEPRSLSQHCRSTIRKSLADNRQWLPDGIKRLALPPRLESFLNLDRDHLYPGNFQASLEN